MASHLLHPPAKRPIQYLSTTAGMPDTAFANGPSNKRPKPPQLPLPVPPGHVAFRLLCHVSRISGVIGKSGSIIKKLQQDTGVKIRIEEAPSECTDRVVAVVGPRALVSKISAGGGGGGNAEVEGVEVSKGQEALIRVFERILKVAAESEGTELAASGGVVSCRLLAGKKDVGSVIGKGGKVVEKIKKECGCKIRVLMDKLPVCAESSDEMVEIEGDVVAVKKGLIAVSRCLQDFQPVDKARTIGGRPVGAVREFPEMHMDMLSDRSSGLITMPNSSLSYVPTMPSKTLSYASGANPLFIESERVSSLHNGSLSYASGPKPFFLESERVPTNPSGSLGYASGTNPLFVESERVPIVPRGSVASGTNLMFPDNERHPSMDTKTLQQEVVFRILCFNDRVGAVIGKGGAVIKAIQNETGALINIGATVADCDERLITISKTEIPESQHSAAQKAVVIVFSRTAEAGSGKELNSGSNKESRLTAKLVVSPKQVGCLLGKGGSIISEMRKATGAGIHIIRTDQVPKCVPENDQVVQISGDLTNIKDALHHVTGRLRNYIFSSTLSSAGTKGTSAMVTDIDPYGSLGGTLREPLREPLRDPLGDTWKDPLRDSFLETWKEPKREYLRDPTPLSLYSSGAGSHSLSRHAALTQDIDHPGISHNLGRPSSPKLWESQTMAQASSRGFTDSGGLSSFKGGIEHGRFGTHTSGTKTAFVTNTTVEIVVPESVVGAVYGENGNNLSRLRQISGAKVIVHEPRLGSSDRIVVISGTPDETQAAQSLLQAFILTGQS